MIVQQIYRNKIRGNFMKKNLKFITIIASAVLAITIPFSTVGAAENEEIIERNSSAIQWLHSTYPNGSYYSKTGRACTCHAESYCEPGTTDNRCTCITYEGASQCNGFARYCYYCYNDEHVEYQDDDYSGSTVALSSDDDVYKCLQEIGNRAYIRGYTRSGSIHSIFVVSYTVNDVTVYQANFDNVCGVKYDTMTHEEFLRYMSRISWCVTGDNQPNFITGDALAEVLDDNT